MDLPEGVPPRPVGTRGRIRRWERQYGARVREAAEAAEAAKAAAPKPVAKKKASKKASYETREMTPEASAPKTDEKTEG